MPSTLPDRARPAHRIFGIAAAGLIWLAPGSEAEEAPPIGVRLVPHGAAFENLRKFRYSLLFEDKVNETPIRSAEWEIRNGEETERVANFPYWWGLGARKLSDERVGRAEGWRMDFSDDEIRRIGELPAGEYHLALKLNGVRASNVIGVKIDPKFDPLTAPTFQIGALEPFPKGKRTEPVIWTIGPTPGDKAISNMSISAAEIMVDGIKRDRAMIIWTGPNALIRDGARAWYLPNLSQYAPPVEADKIHTYGFELAGRKAAPVTIDPADRHLGKKWDEAAIKPAPPPVAVLTGQITTADGAPAAGLKVVLTTPSRTWATEYTDEQGRYSFAGVPAGRYRLNAVADRSGGAEIEEVSIKANKPVVEDLKLGAGRKKDRKPPEPAASPASLRYIDLAKVEATLGKGLDVNERAQDGNTPLAIAAMVGKIDLVKRLVEAGADVNARIGGNYTVLRRAMSKDHLEILEYLISKGARVDQPFPGGGGTLLIDAVGTGNPQIVKLLLAHGADVNGRSKDGLDALGTAAQLGRDEIIPLLIQHGAEIDRVAPGGMTALMWAAQLGRVKTVEALIRSGADVNYANQDGMTALFLAAGGRAKDHDYAGTIQTLLANGAKPSPLTVTEQTPLIEASSLGSTACLSALVEGGADLKGEEGRRAMERALQEKQYASLETLLKLGANPDQIVDNGAQALLYAITMKDDPKEVELLIRGKANVNATQLEPMNEYSMLIAAARYGNPAIVKQLIAAGAKVEFKDDTGKKAVDYAKEANKPEIVKLLREAKKE